VSTEAAGTVPERGETHPLIKKETEVEFGVYLPTYAWPDLAFDQVTRIRDFAQRAETLGFDALWVSEHFVVAGTMAPPGCPRCSV
jgi:hypothetical protein